MALDPRGPPREGFCKQCRQRELVGSYLFGFSSECLASLTLVSVDRARKELERAVPRRAEDTAR